jgi:hypothetical protein
LEKSALVEYKVCQSTAEKKLQLPVFVGEFAEAMIKDDLKKTYHDLIASCMHENMLDFYKRTQNTLLFDHDKESEKVKKKLMSCELNLWSLITRIAYA